MPRNSSEPTLARQWELLKRIPRHRPGATARELCEPLKSAKHDVTKRTGERDLPELSVVFPLECNGVSMPYGWHWQRDISSNIPGITLAEAVSLGLLEDLLSQLVPPTFVTALEGRFNAASSKLSSMPQNRYTKWTDFVRFVQPAAHTSAGTKPDFSSSRHMNELAMSWLSKEGGPIFSFLPHDLPLRGICLPSNGQIIALRVRDSPARSSKLPT